MRNNLLTVTIPTKMGNLEHLGKSSSHSYLAFSSGLAFVCFIDLSQAYNENSKK